MIFHVLDLIVKDGTLANCQCFNTEVCYDVGLCYVSNNEDKLNTVKVT